MRLFGIILSLVVLVSCTSIPNAKTKTIKIWGNCGMCKKTIEQASNKTGEVELNWDPTTKLATIKFDGMQTNLNEILKRVAAVGYDNVKFKASNQAYDALHSCCQYERK
jgi:hypothetical protein